MTRGLFALGLLALGCTPAIPEGHFRCADGYGCPSGWFCRADQRCWSTPGAVSDAGADGGRDGGADGSADGGRDAGPSDACVPTPLPLDLLLMVDNSNSMAEEQASLAEAFPELVRALVTGDVEPDGTRDFEPVADLRVGVVSSDMGTGDVMLPTCAQPRHGDDGILRTQGNTSIAGCRETYPSFLEFAPGGALSAFRQDFRCVATLGTGGCGFEQQLEAALKAVTPSDSALRFYADTTGHGAPSGANAAFLREGSVLVVLLVTDEDDCSVANPALFAPSGPYAGTDLNRRCGEHPEALHPISRYADGLRALRPGHPERLVFSALTGVPLGVEESSYGVILDDPEMALRPNPDMPLTYLPACESSEGRAFPARRIVETAEELSLLGSPTMVRSICRPSFDEPLRQLLTIISARLAPGCD